MDSYFENILRKGKRVVYVEDEISKLPNSIRGHILSFLNTKEAVRTSLLSTRWINTWKFSTTIHLDERRITSKEDVDQFEKVVNKLINMNLSPTVENFSLILSNGDHKHQPNNVNEWISTISKKIVHNFYIEFTARELFPSTFSFSSFDYLVHLIIDMNCEIEVPCTIYLEHLKTLKLQRVVFVKESPEFEEVYFNFPNVRSIVVRNCEWFENACIRANQLDNVSIIMNPDRDQRVARKSMIKILAGPIHNFSFVGDVMNQNVVIEDTRSVRKCYAKIYLNCDKNYSESQMQELGFQACLFLRQFNDAFDVELGGSTLKILAYAEDLFLDMVPKFFNLDSLKMENVPVEMLFKFIQQAPNLECIVLKTVLPFDEEFLYSSITHALCIHNLKLIMFLEFKGDEHEHEFELSLAKFFLKNAERLERMIVSTYWMWESDNKSRLEEIKSQVLAYPRRSSIVQVDFVINVRGDLNPETSAYGNEILKYVLGLI